jgi:hypothetical protein
MKDTQTAMRVYEPAFIFQNKENNKNDLLQLLEFPSDVIKW